MEQQRDEQIPCADCGASFVFSANEAAVFVERGLTPPKRCKSCRRARKERAAQPGGAFSASLPASNVRDGGASTWQARGSAPRHGAPRRYTGDVNEYRSPMGDGFAGSAYGAPARGGAWQGSGEYRSPMPDGNLRRVNDSGRAPRPPRQDGNFRHPSMPQAGGRERSPATRDGGAHPRPARPAPVAGPSTSGAPATEKPARKRPPAEVFPITCNACGAQAEVPFKPAEGREVFCPTCYRARRPSA